MVQCSQYGIRVCEPSVNLWTVFSANHSVCQKKNIVCDMYSTNGTSEAARGERGDITRIIPSHFLINGLEGHTTLGWALHSSDSSQSLFRMVWSIPLPPSYR